MNAHARRADIVVSIAGGMAETEFMKDGRTWRELEETRGDRRSIASARRKLGDKARSIEEYEAECERLIKQHWPMIEAVAARLLKEELCARSGSRQPRRHADQPAIARPQST